MNFLESIGALTIVAGVVYFYLHQVTKHDEEIRFYIWILDNDSTARYEFFKIYHSSISANDPDCRRALRKYFTEEKLQEINERWEKEDNKSLF